MYITIVEGKLLCSIKMKKKRTIKINEIEKIKNREDRDHRLKH